MNILTYVATRVGLMALVWARDALETRLAKKFWKLENKMKNASTRVVLAGEKWDRAIDALDQHEKKNPKNAAAKEDETK